MANIYICETYWESFIHRKHKNTTTRGALNIEIRDKCNTNVTKKQNKIPIYDERPVVLHG